MSTPMSSFPAVATVMGISKEVAESGPLLATLAIPRMMAGSTPAVSVKSEPVDIKAGDPVTQAVVDNIIGKLPTKKELVRLRCEVCNVIVSSQAILNAHFAGARHAKKMKGQELIKEITNSPNATFIATSAQNNTGSNMSEFTCNICNVSVNSYQQLQQHLSGSKHKNKAETSKSNTVSVTNYSEDKGVVNVDIGPNRLYCAACNVHVNSDLQLHQHITSSKHANKVNGRSQPVNSRGAPYFRRSAKGGGGGSWGKNRSYTNKDKNVSNSSWQPSSTGLGLSGWTQQTAAPDKTFVSGGMLYN